MDIQRIVDSKFISFEDLEVLRSSEEVEKIEEHNQGDFMEEDYQPLKVTLDDGYFNLVYIPKHQYK